MTERLLAVALILCVAEPARAQLDTWRSPLNQLLREPPRVVIVPGYTATVGGVDERALAARVQWPSTDSTAGVALTLLGDIVSAGSHLYSRSGLEARIGIDIAGRLPLIGTATVAAGTGAGPSQVLGIVVSTGVPAASLEFRTTWLREPAADEDLPGAGEPVSSDMKHGYMDGELRGNVSMRSAVLGVTTGMRFGEHGDGPGQWAWGEAELPIRGRFSLIASGGVRPHRPELAQRGGGFALLGVRLEVGAGAAQPPVAAAPRNDDAGLRVTALALNRYSVSVFLPGARQVEMIGDVTDWRPRQLTSIPTTPGRWEILLERPAGIYYINVRADGGEWIVPPTLAAVPDRFGGSVGMLILPPFEEVENASY